MRHPHDLVAALPKHLLSRATGVLNVFAVADPQARVLGTARFSARCVGNGPGPVRRLNGLSLYPNPDIQSRNPFNHAVPRGLFVLPAIFGHLDTLLPALVRSRWPQTNPVLGARTATVCAGSFLVRKTGLLKNRP
ncbi:MAG: hypothetical protein AB7E32_05670 [Desulfovibrio sp.]